MSTDGDLGKHLCRIGCAHLAGTEWLQGSDLVLLHGIVDNTPTCAVGTPSKRCCDLHLLPMGSCWQLPDLLDCNRMLTPTRVQQESVEI